MITPHLRAAVVPSCNPCGTWRGPLALILMAIALIAAPMRAQTPAAPSAATGLSMDDLKELVGPIALYPDVLLANVLAASVFPDDIVAAQAMRNAGKDPAKDGDAAWDDSVRFVASFPDVLSMMAQYDEWTSALGQAYLVQPKDVLEVIQELRTIAWDNGALQTNEQQVVVREAQTIVIEPANPQVVFVPVYTPSVVFVRQPVAPVVIGFGVGVAVGAIWGGSTVHCNWRGGCVAWGPGWWSRSRTNVNVNVNRNVNRNININNRNINVGGGGGWSGGSIPSRRPGADGSPWRPDSSRIPSGGASGGRRPSLDDFRGISGGGAGSGRIPGRGQSPGSGGAAGGRPQLPSQPPSLNRPGGTARPTPPQARPAERPSRPSTPPSTQRPSRPSAPSNVQRPSRPSAPANVGGPSRPTGGSGGRAPAVSAPSAPSRGSAFQPGAGGGSLPSGGAGGRIGGARGR